MLRTAVFISCAFVFWFSTCPRDTGFNLLYLDFSFSEIGVRSAFHCFIFFCSYLVFGMKTWCCTLSWTPNGDFWTSWFVDDSVYHVLQRYVWVSTLPFISYSSWCSGCRGSWYQYLQIQSPESLLASLPSILPTSLVGIQQVQIATFLGMPLSVHEHNKECAHSLLRRTVPMFSATESSWLRYRLQWANGCICSIRLLRGGPGGWCCLQPII